MPEVVCRWQPRCYGTGLFLGNDMIPTEGTLSWLQVPEVTQASKVLRGSQEAEANQESLEPRGLQAHPSEMKVMRFHSIRTYLVSGMDMDQ